VAIAPHEDADTLGLWLRVRLWTAALVFTVIAAGLFLSGIPSAATGTILLFVAAYLLIGLVELFYYCFRGLSRSDLESTITLALRGSTLLTALVLLWWTPSAAWLAFAMLLPAAVAFFWVRRLAATLVGTPSPVRRWTLAARAQLHRLAPVGAGIVLSALYFRVDALLVDAWLGATALGLYNAAFRLVDALRLLPAAVLAVFLSRLFQATTRTPLLVVAAPLAAGAVLLSAGLAIVAGWLLPALFGARFSEAVPAFRILLLAFPLMSLNYALTHQLIGWNGHRAYAAACAAALAFNVALNARLIPAAGIEGAAWTTVWTEVVMTAICGVALVRLDPAGVCRAAQRTAS
jgi:O-antigen/teichoic acid export membrane protein